MSQRRRKIIATILIFMLTITHFSVIGEVLASSLAIGEGKPIIEIGQYKVSSIEEGIYVVVNFGINSAGPSYVADYDIYNTNENFYIVPDPNEEQNYIINGNQIEARVIGPAYNEVKFILKLKENIEEININDLTFTEIYAIGHFIEEDIDTGETYGKSGDARKELPISWKVDKPAILDMQISKYIPYDINGNRGLVLETKVQSYLQDNQYPINSNKIEIDVPTINNIKPKSINVIANTTKATNGDANAENFTEENYTYDVNTNKLTIIVENERNLEGKVSWKKNAKDEFVVNYIYPEEAMTQTNTNIKLNAKSTLDLYNQGKKTATYAKTETLSGQINNLVEISASTNIKNSSKGQIYANYEVGNKVETEYEQAVTVNIGEANITDKVILEQNVDNFITEENTKKAATQTYYKTITVDKKEANTILGENGEIYFYSGQTEIARIDKNTIANEQGKFIVDLSQMNINTLRIETSKPQKEGRLKFDIVKALKGDIGYSKLEMKNIKAIEVNTTGKALNTNTEFVNQLVEKQIAFTEPTSKAEITIDKTNLSTVVTNENVKITAKLKTDTLDCNLYQNPTLQIVMPSYIENINIKNVEVLFDKEGSKLTLKSHEVVQNQDGTKTISVALDGKQTEYTLGAVSKGVNVVITSDITVNKFTPNKQDQVKMIYTNSNVITNVNGRTNPVETNEVTTTINIVAPVGVITTSTISNYKDAAQAITSISGEENVATIPILSKERTANLSMEVINNYNNTIDNISILGRTAFKGNKDILTAEDLGTTVNMPLTSNVVVTGVDAGKVQIYYSENGEASKDITLPANAWTLTPASLENIKSYLIVITNHTMNTGDRIRFNYTMKIPANMQHNESAYENYVAYFNNNLATGTIEDKQASTKVGVTTGRGPELEVKMTSNISETIEVQTGKFIKYTVTIKNIGEEVADNVVATINIPNSTKYVEFFTGENGQYMEKNQSQIEYQLEKINPNEEISKNFWVIVKNISVEDFCKDDTHYVEVNGTKMHSINIRHNLEEYKTTISTSATITATKLSKAIKSNEVKNTISKSYFNSLVGTTTNGIENLRKGDSFVYNISIWSTQETVENTVLKTTIPEGLEYKSTEIKKYNLDTQKNELTDDKFSYDEKTRELTINLGSVSNQDNRSIKIISEVGELGKEEYSRKITSVARIKADGVKEEVTNEIIDIIVKNAIKVSQTSTIPEGNKVSAGEKYSYKVLIENIGADEVGNVKIEDQLPAELQYVNTEYTILGETKITSNIDENNITKVMLNVPKGETVEVKINVSAKEIAEEKQINNVAKVSSDTMSTVTTNEVKHIIEAVDYANKDDVNSIVRKITGQVWKDENNNGIKEENESKANNVEVMLFNNQTGKLVTDASGNVLKQITNEEGTYTFSNMQQGKYTVIFLYDTANCSATTYRAKDVDETINSDAIDTQITLDGVMKAVAITEEIDVNTNIYNIDLGLVSNPKFDLKLDKTVSKITVQDTKGTTVYEFNDTKLAKKDLVEKDINNTTVIVEYKIKVTNEGAISGFVKKIADYMPSEMKFNSELNRDWYTSGNGLLYNSSLANTIINPGESKEVTLTLTKKMTEENLGLYHNEAEIYEAYNDLGIEDIDSVEGNKLSNEDDISSADVLITVKTGEVLLFVGLSLSIIITIGIGAYFIKKRVLR